VLRVLSCPLVEEVGAGSCEQLPRGHGRPGRVGFTHSVRHENIAGVPRAREGETARGVVSSDAHTEKIPISHTSRMV